nr:polysaccharide deacetylase [Lachnospiraceae bacterium]
MSQNTEERTARVGVLKKWIIAFLILGILLPILLCILLFIKVEQLQQQVNMLSAARKAGALQDASIVIVDSVDLADQIVIKEQAVALDVGPGGANPAGEISSEGDANRKDAVKDGREDVTKVYLTFDDGPSSYTDEILDILKQYDVKATFFVTGKTQDVYAPLYRRIVEEGHTLGMHSYSHRYHEIYASREMFAEDLEKLQEFLYDTTGVWSRFYRFPGGSSNRVSDVPMEELAEYLTQEDIFYLDWNVSCGDATGRRLSPQQIADNVTEHVEKYHTAVVLLHDASDKTATVEALPLMIEKLQSMENIEFVPVDDEMTMVQHLQQEKDVN